MNMQSRSGKRLRAAMALALGGSAFQLSGCDPAVRTTLLDGLLVTTSSLSTALINAFFLSLADDESSTDSLTTTKMRTDL